MAGLYFGWHSHTAFDADVRLSAIAFWEVLAFILNALIFILLGLQFPALSDQLPVGDVLGPGVAIAGTVVVLRLLAQFVPYASLPVSARGRFWRNPLTCGSGDPPGG